MNNSIKSEQFLGINEDRLHHIISVARKCYSIAQKRGHDENFCRRMFLCGYLHDVGYEFSKTQIEHPDVSANLCIDAFDLLDNQRKSPFLMSILTHGHIPESVSEEWAILNYADLTTSPVGKDISIKERLDDIMSRYGEASPQYKTSLEIAGILSRLGYIPNICTC